jgi:tetratricopeptide (TPR) repeat protein
LKIAEVEKLIETNGLSEELFEEFKLSLKRVPALLRCQHCYITAYHLRTSKTNEEQREKNYEDAFRLIEYGIEIHPKQVPKNQKSADFYLRAAYEHMGMAYGDIGNYELAKFNLQKASTIEEPSKTMDIYWAYLIVRMELHCSHFTYTPYLQELYDKMLMADEFAFNLRKNLFYRSLVEIIIANKNKDKKAKRIACNNALRAFGIETTSNTDKILKKHKALFALMVNPSDEALAFLKKNL